MRCSGTRTDSGHASSHRGVSCGRRKAIRSDCGHWRQLLRPDQWGFDPRFRAPFEVDGGWTEDIMHHSEGESMTGKITKHKMTTGKMITAALFAVTALSPLAHAQELQVGSNAY